MVDDKSASKVESAVAEAISHIQNNKILSHRHSWRCYHLLQPILSPDEYTVMEVKQSHFESLSPMRIIATNQRLIIAKPSFWGLRTGVNIFSSTKYETIPYNHIISITLNEGRLFSSLQIHLDVSTNVEGGAIHGLSSNAAKTTFIFLEKLTSCLMDSYKPKLRQNGENVPRPVREKEINYIGMETARRVVRRKGTKFVWLGIEPLDYALDILCINREIAMKINIDELDKHDRESLRQFEDCIFVCYDGDLATHVSGHLKKAYDINSYVLTGGIEAQMEAVNQ